MTPEQPVTERVRIRVTGTVQGVGFRPFAVALAGRLGLVGYVGNDPGGVVLEAQGDPHALAELHRRLASEAPRLARVESVSVSVIDPNPLVQKGFVIAASGRSAGVTSIPPDTAVCDDCLRELRDPADRRFGYPFIACTNCGPRYSMTTRLPYDRVNTTMADFPLCAACQVEYADPASRRFHAQPTACGDCGPRLSIPVADLVRLLQAGRIVAVKGIGGYHLVCAAGDPAAVDRLRERKRRGGKPMAVMVPDLLAAQQIAAVSEEATRALTGSSRPIVVAAARERDLADRVAPGTGTVGVMLPYTPLHHLLADAGAPWPLVMTSGNLADEPICIDAGEAEDRLAGIADAFCHHDRRIHVACDDSVVRVGSDGMQPVRRSRGIAPAPLPLPVPALPLLAVGGELKTTVCVAAAGQAWLSQHVGDTENLATLAMLDRTASTLAALQRVRPEMVISDRHPAYLSRRWAAQHASRLGVPHADVQHHHAHVAALLAEHRISPDEPVLGIVFDGTGYGDDGTIWGGEFLLGSYAAVRRVGHLRPVSLPGGDAAIRHPARTALAHLAAAGLSVEGTASGNALPDSDIRVLCRMLATGSHCTPTTSAGRLFDAIASLLDVRHAIDYEAQAAIELEACAAAWAEPHTTADPVPGWSVSVHDDPDGIVLDPRPWVAQAVADRRNGIPAGASARAFHRALADSVAEATHRIVADTDVRAVGLTGGVFANAVLVRDCVDALRARGFRVLVHRRVPPNDGGLALGQAAVAAAGGARIVSQPTGGQDRSTPCV